MCECSKRVYVPCLRCSVFTLILNNGTAFTSYLPKLSRLYTLKLSRITIWSFLFYYCAQPTYRRGWDKMSGKKAFNIDDIGNVNSFLALIGGSQVSSPPESERTTVSTSERSPVAQPSGLAAAENGVPVSLQPGLTLFVEVNSTDTKQKQDRPVPNRQSQLLSASAAPGKAAPPAPPSTPTAGTMAASNTMLTPLDHIEDGSDILRTIANASNLNLNDSVHAPKNFRSTRAQNSDLKYATMPTRRTPIMSYSNSFAPLDENQTSETLNKKSEQEKLITKYQDEVIANFVKEKSPESKRKVRLY